MNGFAAALTLLTFRNITPGLCLHYVWQAYKAHGARATGTYPTAYAAWLASPGKHTDRYPPAGVPVYWGPRAGSSAGDVVISLGDGRVAATDWPAAGQVGTCTLDERERQIGRPYLGWTDNILGYPIDLPRPTPAPAPAPAPAPQPQEDDMSAYSFGHRRSTPAEPSADEWMLVGADLRGPDDKQIGYLVTTDQARAQLWARLYQNGWASKLVGVGGRYRFDVPRSEYIALQLEARRIAAASILGADE